LRVWLWLGFGSNGLLWDVDFLTGLMGMNKRMPRMRILGERSNGKTPQNHFHVSTRKEVHGCVVLLFLIPKLSLLIIAVSLPLVTKVSKLQGSIWQILSFCDINDY